MHKVQVDMRELTVGTKLVAKSTKHENFLQDGEFHTRCGPPNEQFHTRFDQG